MISPGANQISEHRTGSTRVSLQGSAVSMKGLFSAGRITLMEEAAEFGHVIHAESPFQLYCDRAVDHLQSLTLSISLSLLCCHVNINDPDFSFA